MSISKRKWLKIILVCFHILHGRAMSLPLRKDINISQIKADGHGCNLSEQLPRCTTFSFIFNGYLTF